MRRPPCSGSDSSDGSRGSFCPAPLLKSWRVFGPACHWLSSSWLFLRWSRPPAASASRLCRHSAGLGSLTCGPESSCSESLASSSTPFSRSSSAAFSPGSAAPVAKLPRPQGTNMLNVSHLTHTYGTGAKAHLALKDITFEVQPGELVSIVGPSGCGKTTLLRTMAVLMRPTGGDLTFLGDEITSVPEGLAMVF